jgi:hypothetical protein
MAIEEPRINVALTNSNGRVGIAIFARNADQLAQTDLPRQWPTFRAAFLRHDRKG